MCLIVYQPPGQRVPIERLREAHKANPDSWGFMWADGTFLMDSKSTEFSLFENTYKVMTTTFPDAPFVIHFRTASMGQITKEACHPHRINDELAFVHNGNLFHFSDYFYTDRRTDSQRFCDWLKKNWCPAIVPDIERYCVANYSKMVFMNSQGQVWICNERAGMWENGCWFSNGGIEHYVGYGYSGAYPYAPGEVRHKGGLISVQGYSGEWVQCEKCNGWFKNINKLCEDCETYVTLSGNTGL